MATIWVAVLHISSATARKIVQKHGVGVGELRSAWHLGSAYFTDV